MDETNLVFEPESTEPATPSGPSGIGGWLILPAIGVVLTPLALAVSLAVVAGNMGNISGRVTGYLTFNMAIDLLLLIYAVIVAVLFFKKRKAAPGAYINLLVFSVLTSVASIIIALALGIHEFIETDIKAMAKGAVGCAIWIPYFKRSIRVKNTFTD